MDLLFGLGCGCAFARWFGGVRPALHRAEIFAKVVENRLALSYRGVYTVRNTRAAPLVRKDNAHQGRVFYCPQTAVEGRLCR